MNPIEKLKKELEKRESALSKLTDEKTKLSSAIDGMKAERFAAVRSLAGADDEGQKSLFRKRILGLESSMAPLLLRVEGLSALVIEAEGELQKTHDALKEFEAEREARRKADEEEQVGNNSQRIYDSLPSLFRKAVEDQILADKSKGELAIAESILKIRRDEGSREFSERASRFLDVIGDEYKRRGVVGLDGKPWPGFITTGPAIVLSELPADFKGRAHSTQDHAEYRDAKLRAELRAKFDSMESK